MFKTQFVRDGDNQIIGDETRFENGDAVVRDQSGRILGRTSETFRNTRDGDGKLGSRNTNDVGLLFRKFTSRNRGSGPRCCAHLY